MDNYDLKRELRPLYSPGPTFQAVDVPELTYLAVDGAGDPNRSASYVSAVTTLFVASYAVRALAIAELGRKHTVGPLEGLWSADDPTTFVTRDKQAWRWTMMIAQPPYLDISLVRRGLDTVSAAKAPALGDLAVRTIAEGRCLQALHVGSYDDEGPALRDLHERLMPELGLTFHGPHHEIYLSDARKTAPEKLRTILRQPVRPR